MLAALASGQSWTPVAASYPGSGAGASYLLTDGTVMVHQEQSATDAWYKLTPDINGSYVNGTWTELAPIPFYSPLFFGAAVLPNGQLLVEGGEYNKLNPDWTNMGALYNPVTNKWAKINPPAGWTSIGDARTSSLIMAPTCRPTAAPLSLLTSIRQDINGRHSAATENSTCSTKRDSTCCRTAKFCRLMPTYFNTTPRE
jgi:hypothetical protein